MENLSLVDDRFWSLLGVDVDAWRLTKNNAFIVRFVVAWRAGTRAVEVFMKLKVEHLLFYFAN